MTASPLQVEIQEDGASVRNKEKKDLQGEKDNRQHDAPPPPLTPPPGGEDVDDNMASATPVPPTLTRLVNIDRLQMSPGAYSVEGPSLGDDSPNVSREPGPPPFSDNLPFTEEETLVSATLVVEDSDREDSQPQPQLEQQQIQQQQNIEVVHAELMYHTTTHCEEQKSEEQHTTMVSRIQCKIFFRLVLVSCFATFGLVCLGLGLGVIFLKNNGRFSNTSQRNNDQFDDDYDGSPFDDEYADPELLSFHAVNWGGATTCGPINDEIFLTCGGAGVIDLVDVRDAECYGFGEASLTCNGHDFRSYVLFSCVGYHVDDLEGIARQQESHVSECEIIKSESNDDQDGADEGNIVMYGGSATSYISMGRFCFGNAFDDEGLSDMNVLADGYSCAGGKQTSVRCDDYDYETCAVASDEELSSDGWQSFCYSAGSCTYDPTCHHDVEEICDDKESSCEILLDVVEVSSWDDRAGCTFESDRDSIRPDEMWWYVEDTMNKHDAFIDHLWRKMIEQFEK